MKILTREQTAMRTSMVSIGGNLFLCFVKLFAGILGKSGALVSDAIHSAADAVDTIIVMIGVKLASKAPDAQHPYGHERLECAAAIILSLILGLVGLGIGFAGAETILFHDHGHDALETPNRLALFTALAAIAIKELLYWYMRAKAKGIDSEALMAIAWHNQADALSSIGSFIGILGARAGFDILDPLVSVIICLFVIKTALTIFKGSIDKMVDRACPPDMIEAITAAVHDSDPELSIGQFRTRLFGDRIYGEMEILLPDEITLAQANDICRHTRETIESRFENVKECRVIPVPANK